jgi:hypothetical protein
MCHDRNMRGLHGPLALALFLGLVLVSGCLDLDPGMPPPCTPVSDGNPCTVDKCVDDATTTYSNAPEGAQCGAGGKLKCDGAGSCVGCTDSSECDVFEPCAVWTCNIGVCTRIIKAVGTFAGDDTKADCKADYCNAIGLLEKGAYTADVKEDGNECTADACSSKGDPINAPVPDGTKCGTGCTTCTGGVCGGCSSGYVCNPMVDACVPVQQLPNGSACTFTTDCASGNCVDGVCCDSACTSPCMACNSTKTGQADGICNNIAAGTDPDNECQSPEGDVCNAGTCQCNNGVQDGTEFKVDCGGNCTPCPGKWSCEGSPPCEGMTTSNCCGQFCGLCQDFSSTCKALHGTPCVIGQDQPKAYGIKLGTTPECNAQISQACFIANCVCK